MDTETIAMTLIAHSGDARTLAFQALQAAKKHDFEEAERASDPFPGSPDDQYAGSGADRRDD